MSARSFRPHWLPWSLFTPELTKMFVPFLKILFGCICIFELLKWPFRASCLVMWISQKETWLIYSSGDHECLPCLSLGYPVADSSTFFFNFWLRAVSKFPSTWKDGLSIKELTKFIGDGSKKLQNFTEVCVGEGTSLPTTIQKSVKFLDFA